MCFSSTASFAVSTALLVGGVASLKQVSKPSQIPFAAIPLLFAAQQFCEGIIWMSFSGEPYSHYGKTFIYLYLVFAQVVWPTWVPLSVLLLENNKDRKRILAIALAIGTVVSINLAYCIISYDVHASVGSHHIHYDLDFPSTPSYYSGLLYFIATVLSLFISGVNKMWVVGFSTLISFLAARIFFGEYLISVWCFFAAAISFSVLYVMRTLAKKSPSFL